MTVLAALVVVVAVLVGLGLLLGPSIYAVRRVLSDIRSGTLKRGKESEYYDPYFHVWRRKGIPDDDADTADESPHRR